MGWVPAFPHLKIEMWGTQDAAGFGGQKQTTFCQKQGYTG
jgi:hypothetical protein